LATKFDSAPGEAEAGLLSEALPPFGVVEQDVRDAIATMDAAIKDARSDLFINSPVIHIYIIQNSCAEKYYKMGGDEIPSSHNPNPGFNFGDRRSVSDLADRQISGRAFQRRQSAVA
jgi:hypothetical protein